MSAERLSDGEQSQFIAAAMLWVALVAVGLAFSLIVIFLKINALRSGLSFEQSVSYQLVSHAHLLLIGSTILYISHLRFTSERVGRWATGFAAAGAVCLILSMLVRWIESYYLHSVGRVSIAGLYEVMSLFSAITVVIYLVMEKVYLTRSAGAFVMPIVVSAVLFEIWLVSNGQAAPDYTVPLSKSFWIYAHVLANSIGYGAFAVAALMGMVYMLRQRAERQSHIEGFAMRLLPNLPSIDRFMHQAILLGFSLFTVATMLGIVSAYQAWGTSWSWGFKETWTLIVWVTYAGYFYLRHVRNWQGVWLAWWVIIGFAITVFCFFGVSLWSSEAHAYRQPGIWRVGST